MRVGGLVRGEVAHARWKRRLDRGELRIGQPRRIVLWIDRLQLALQHRCAHRQSGVEPEAYLIDLVTALAAGAPHIIADWLPRVWKRRRADGLTA